MMTNSNVRADYIIRGADVIDGLGNPGVCANVAVTDDRILAVGDLENMTSSIEVDANGKTLAPGFIDAHTHDDRA